MSTQNFTIYRYADGLLTVPVSPPVPVGGWSVEFIMTKRQDGTPIVTKSVASGFNGQSGINITDSGNGTMIISLFASEVSGIDQGSYAYRVTRTDSGFHSVLCNGYRLAL